MFFKINNHKINYILKKKKINGSKYSVVFLTGYMSDIEGEKSKFLQNLQKKYGFEFLTFDYSGHGKSSGNVFFGNIKDWVNESIELIENKTKYPLILVGSSMGGWIAFLITLQFLPF